MVGLSGLSAAAELSEALICGDAAARTATRSCDGRPLAAAGVKVKSEMLRGREPSRPAEAVHFDPRNDVAILRVSGLDAPPLTLAQDPDVGTSAAILGFPLNGPFDVRAGRLGETRRVNSSDAYGRGPVERSMTALRGLVRPGNSGGPMVDGEGRGLQVITDGKGNCGFPSWSPDGREIVYRSSTAANPGLFIVTLATGVVRAVGGTTSRDNFPAWSPKGDRIAFTGYRDGNYDLYTVRPDGTDLRRLTEAPGNDAHCEWSPDGKWLAFSSSRGGFKDEAALHPGNAQPYGDIYVMREDGSRHSIATIRSMRQKCNRQWIH